MPLVHHVGPERIEPMNSPKDQQLSKAQQSGWYFGWNIVAAATLLTLFTVGMRLGIGPFFLPMSEDLGFSRSLLAGMVAIGMLCYGLAMPLAGYLVAKYSTKTVLILVFLPFEKKLETRMKFLVLLKPPLILSVITMKSSTDLVIPII